MISDFVLATRYEFFFFIVYFYSVIADAVHNFCPDIYDQPHTVVFPCVPRNFPLLQGGSLNPYPANVDDMASSYQC